MLPPLDYIEFAVRHFGRSEWDLAASGMTPITAAELGGDLDFADFLQRERFAATLADRYRVPQSEVVPCLGTSGALFTACAALLGAGDTVLVESPVYEPLLRIPQGVGARITRFERVRSAAYAIEPERVLAALEPATRLVIVTNPHNPTNAVTPDDVLRELARALDDRGVKLLVDEAYLELFRPAASARTLGPNVLTCSSATKCWGVPWARAGWLFAPGELEPALATVQRHVVGQAPPACWAFGARAVTLADRLLARTHSLQQGKRALVDAFMAGVAAQLEWCAPPAAALFGWVEARDGRSLSEPVDRAREDRGVLVAPGRFFGNDAAFRLSWIVPAPALEAALATLSSALCVDSGAPA